MDESIDIYDIHLSLCMHNTNYYSLLQYAMDGSIDIYDIYEDVCPDPKQKRTRTQAGISAPSLGGISRRHLGGISRRHFGGISRRHISAAYLGGISRMYLGYISGIYRAGVRLARGASQSKSPSPRAPWSRPSRADDNIADISYMRR